MSAFPSTLTSTSTSLQPPKTSPTTTASPEERFYPGLANASATLCFLNAVLQALASVTDLSRYLARSRLRLQASLPRPSVIVALSETLAELNVPRPRRTILRPTGVVEALIAGQPACSRLFDSCQQDAHELLVMVVEAIDRELAQLAAPLQPGLGALVAAEPLPSPPERSPFRGLMANRVACAACGFSAGIHHLATDHLSVNLPTRVSSHALSPAPSLRPPAHTARPSAGLVHARGLSPRLHPPRDPRPIHLSKVHPPVCRTIAPRPALRRPFQAHPPRPQTRPRPSRRGATRGARPGPPADGRRGPRARPEPDDDQADHVCQGRPPDVLTIHVSRSTVFASGQLLKNHCRLVFPEILILDRFTTSPSLCARAEAPISRPSPGAPARQLLHLYRLLGVVVHQGTHLSGHYLTFRRAPTGSWWRVSDEEVERCEVTEALDSNPTLLLYQRLGNEDRVT